MNPDLLIRFGGIALVSLASSYVLFRAMFWLFPKYGLLDNPAPYGHKRPPVPLGMGAVFYFNFLILSILFLPYSSKLLILLVL